MIRTESTKARGSGKFLALLASLTMMFAGLVGVVLASPASADPGGNSPEATCGAGVHLSAHCRGRTRSASDGTRSATVTYATGGSGTWTSAPGAESVWLHAGEGQAKTNVGSGTSGNWMSGDDGKYDLSTITFCYAPEEPDFIVDVVKVWRVRNRCSGGDSRTLDESNAGTLTASAGDGNSLSWGTNGPFAWRR